MNDHHFVSSNSLLRHTLIHFSAHTRSHWRAKSRACFRYSRTGVRGGSVCCSRSLNAALHWSVQPYRTNTRTSATPLTVTHWTFQVPSLCLHKHAHARTRTSRTRTVIMSNGIDIVTQTCTQKLVRWAVQTGKERKQGWWPKHEPCQSSAACHWSSLTINSKEEETEAHKIPVTGPKTQLEKKHMVL